MKVKLPEWPKEKAEIINKAQDLGMEIREGSNIYADNCWISWKKPGQSLS